MKKNYIEKARIKHGNIVYWGMGYICQCCLRCYPDINPLFFVDSYSTYSSYENRAVKRPEEISNWIDYYVIVTVKAEEAKIKIQRYLEKKGLIKGQNFSVYDEFFSCSDISLETSVCLAEQYKKEYLNAVNPTLLQIPLEEIRNHKDCMSFISNYAQKQKEKGCIVLTSLQVMSRELAIKKIKCPIIPMVNESIERKIKRFESICESLTKKELSWLRELEKRKKVSDKEKEFCNSVNLYYYYKSIIEIIKPSKIIIWGNWNRESYMWDYLSDIYNIPHGYMEYGWIPGTYQVDPRGIAGQSEYAVNPHLFKNIEIDNAYNIKQIKQYVKNKKLDTRTFSNTEADNTALSEMKKEKKTVFLVGMDDCGMKMNPKNTYWKKYISSVVESTEEALFLLVKLCRKNNWNLIFKPHPKNSVPELGEYSDDVILVKDMQIDRLIELADVVVSIASAVDYKALIYGKPLVQLGITGLLGKDCTYSVTEKNGLEEQLVLALKNGMTGRQTENFDRLLQILLQRYLWDDMSERSLRYGLTIEHDFLEGRTGRE